MGISVRTAETVKATTPYYCKSTLRGLTTNIALFGLDHRDGGWSEVPQKSEWTPHAEGEMWLGRGGVTVIVL